MDTETNPFSFAHGIVHVLPPSGNLITLSHDGQVWQMTGDASDYVARENAIASARRHGTRVARMPAHGGYLASVWYALPASADAAREAIPNLPCGCEPGACYCA